MSAQTVLIDDDDDDIAESITDLLVERGLTVLRARDGEEAMVVLDNHSVQMILLDLLMPMVSGWEFLAERRRSERITGIPVIAISGSQVALEHTRHDLIEAVLIKPFTSADLFELVGRYVKLS
ncbi:MAG: response regulator, partial [Gammaproteobacteria bacterium]